MPNHMTQQLTIRGAAAPQVIDTIAGDQESFDFNRVIPLPEELKVQKCTHGELGVAVLTGHVQEYLDSAWVQQLGLTTSDAFIAYVREEKPDAIELGQAYLNNERVYGFRTWYGWCTHHWGTKWNAYSVTDPDIALGRAVLSYDTAWSPAIPVIVRLAEMFPSTEFVLKYLDDGWTTAGMFQVVDGDCADDAFVPDPDDEQTQALYRDIFGEEDTLED